MLMIMPLIIVVSTNFWLTTRAHCFINGSPAFSNSQRSLPRNTSDCVILDSKFFENLMMNDDLIAKDLWRLATYLSFSNSLWGKCLHHHQLHFMIISELSQMHFLPLILVNWAVNLIIFLLLYRIEPFYNNAEIILQNSFTSSMMNNIFLFPACSRLPVRFICCKTFASELKACWLLRSIVIKWMFSHVAMLFFVIDQDVVAFYLISSSGRKYPVCPVLTALSSNNSRKSLLTSWKLGSIK